MTYAGLTTADKGALLDAKARGFKTVKPFHQSANEWDVDLALAQIAEMERALPDHAPRHEQPMTLNDWLNGATVEEKAKWLYDMDVCRVSSISIEECNSYRHCTDCMRNLLNSPYTEGEIDEG